MIRDYRNLMADNTFDKMLLNPGLIPFVFTYRSVRYEGFSSDKMTFLSEKEERIEGKHSVSFIYALFDGVKVLVQLSHYCTHGATEFTVWFENDTKHDSGIIEDAHAKIHFSGMDMRVTGSLGDHVNFYRPYDLRLSDKNVHFSSDSGRATHVYFPYFNLKWAGGGAFLSIGWAGTWRADFEKTKADVI